MHLSYFCICVQCTAIRLAVSAALATLKVNNDAADFFWQESVSRLCICMFYVYYCKNESPGCTVSGILLGQFITYTVHGFKDYPRPSFPWKWLIRISLESLFPCTIFHGIFEELYFKMKHVPFIKTSNTWWYHERLWICLHIIISELPPPSDNKNTVIFNYYCYE